MKKYGIFGGTFDPIHKGHITLAKEAISKMDLTEVIFVPAKLQPFKLDKKVTDSNLRYEMIKIATDKEDKMRVSTYEMDKEDISYTYLTLEYFRNILDGKVYFICGTDSFLMMESWKEGKKFLRENEFIVGSRPGIEDDLLEKQKDYYEKKYNAIIHRIVNRKIDMSSTEARAGQGQDKIDENVKVYMEKKKLYE